MEPNARQQGLFLILAAGKGTRMRSPTAKVLHPLAGRPMVRLLLDSLRSIPKFKPVVVIGHDRDQVKAALGAGVETVVQWPARGTGHAVQVARSKIARTSEVVVMPGDAPLITPETIRRMLDLHRRSRALATVLTAEPDDPAAYGRVVMHSDGAVEKIVEAADADPATLTIHRINTGFYVFDSKSLLSVIGKIGSSNKKGEYYLTDAIELLARRGRVMGLNTDDTDEVAGINTQAELARMEGVLQKRLRRKLLECGVQIPHPQEVYLEPDVTVEPTARILPGTHLSGRTVVKSGAVIGPDTFVSDSRIGPRARVWYSVVEGADVGTGVTVGPYAHLRSGARLAENSRIGNFVEVKESTVGRRAKALHLAYLGNATVGDEANIGAGTITCNYDGFKKYPTRIAPRAFIGSNTALVAPVTIGAGAVVGAGSVITRNVPSDSLAIERSPQVIRPGWAKLKRALARRIAGSNRAPGKRKHS